MYERYAAAMTPSSLTDTDYSYVNASADKPLNEMQDEQRNEHCSQKFDTERELNG